jgi:two-component system nitrogen regulation sensor histidine kinase NtrY
MDVAQSYYQMLESTALRHGRYMARTVERDGLLEDGRREALAAYLTEQQERLGVAAVTVWSRQGQELAHVKNPGLGAIPLRDTSREHIRQALAGQEITTVQELDNGDMIQAVVPVRGGDGPEGVMVVGIHVPQRLEARLRGISQAFQEYKQLKLLKNPIKGIYILLFLLMTLIIVFSATWFGLYLARGITDPIAMLAEGTREVAAGNLKYKVLVRADDEIGTLVDSFNRMTGDLSASQAKLEETYRDLQAKHTEMEQRRRYTETVLETVATGVVSLDADGHITTINGAAERLLGLPAASILAKAANAVFRPPEYAEIATLIQRMGRRREGMVDGEVHLRRDGQAVALLASATALRGPHGSYMGMVLAFDDLTELLKAQRLAAWREVAQRIAHEIKNPLTPIQLSAQRLRRRLSGDGSPARSASSRKRRPPSSTRWKGSSSSWTSSRASPACPPSPPSRPTSRDSSRASSSSTATRTRRCPSGGCSRPSCGRCRSIRTSSSAPCSTWSTMRSRREPDRRRDGGDGVAARKPPRAHRRQRRWAGHHG